MHKSNTSTIREKGEAYSLVSGSGSSLIFFPFLPESLVVFFFDFLAGSVVVLSSTSGGSTSTAMELSSSSMEEYCRALSTVSSSDGSITEGASGVSGTVLLSVVVGTAMVWDSLERRSIEGEAVGGGGEVVGGAMVLLVIGVEEVGVKSNISTLVTYDLNPTSNQIHFHKVGRRQRALRHRCLWADSVQRLHSPHSRQSTNKWTEYIFMFFSKWFLVFGNKYKNLNMNKRANQITCFFFFGTSLTFARTVHRIFHFILVEGAVVGVGRVSVFSFIAFSFSGTRIPDWIICVLIAYLSILFSISISFKMFLSSEQVGRSIC